jgi:hypothetical protein
MSPGEHLGVAATAAGHAPASFVFGARTSNARGAASAPALASGAARLAFARCLSHAKRGPLSFRHSLRHVRCGAPSSLASAAAAKVNWAIYADTQVTPAAARPRFPGAGNFQR